MFRRGGRRGSTRWWRCAGSEDCPSVVAARLDDAPDFAIPFVDDRNSDLRSRPDLDWDHAGNSRYSNSRHPGLLCSLGCCPSDWYMEVPVAGIMGFPGSAPDAPAAAGSCSGQHGRASTTIWRLVYRLAASKNQFWPRMDTDGHGWTRIKSPSLFLSV